jgi:hypothetical protein
MMDAPTQDDRRARRLSPVMWVLATLLLVAAAIAAAIKWQQDAALHAAQRGLREIGVTFSIHSVAPSRLIAEFSTQRPALSDAEVRQLAEHAATLARPHDLGLSGGLEIAVIDLSGTTTSPESLAMLRDVFPNAEIRATADSAPSTNSARR